MTEIYHLLIAGPCALWSLSANPLRILVFLLIARDSKAKLRGEGGIVCTLILI